jgi:hypothetical protein
MVHNDTNVTGDQYNFVNFKINFCQIVNPLGILWTDP